MGACAAPKVARPSSDQVSGCDSSLEFAGVLCCIDAEPPAPVSTTTAAAALPAGPSCTAYGVTGVCLNRNSCPRGTSPNANRSGFVSGCGNLASNVQCCSAGKPPALPVGKTCVGYGRTGSCLASSQCAAPYRAYAYRRGYVEGCENEPSNVQCCSTGVAPSDSLPPISGPTPSSGTITACQTAALLQRAGVPARYVHTLTCVARYESTYNCGAQNLRNVDGSSDHGLFQANSRYWCTGGRGRNLGNGCRTTCASLLNCANAASCAATILRTHNGGAPRSLNAWVAYTSHRSTCDNYRVPPSCGVSLLVGEDGEEVQVFSGEGTGDEASNDIATGDTDNSLAIGLGVGIPLAVICIVGVIVALVMMNRRTKFEVNEDVPAHAMVSARSERQGGNNQCSHCGKSYPTAADLAHHVNLRHP